MQEPINVRAVEKTKSSLKHDQRKKKGSTKVDNNGNTIQIYELT